MYFSFSKLREKRKQQTVLVIAFKKCYIIDSYIENYEQFNDNKLLNQTVKTTNDP